MLDVIEKLCKENGTSVTALCKMVTGSSGNLPTWKKGNIRNDYLLKIAQYFNVSTDFLLGRDEIIKKISIPMGEMVRIPILGVIRAGEPVLAVQNIEGYTYGDYTPADEYFALKVKGDSMNLARIQEGDLVIVHSQKCCDNGEIAVVLVNGEDATVKRVYFGENTVTLMPQSTNPEHRPTIVDLTKTHFEILGKVIEVKIIL